MKTSFGGRRRWHPAFVLVVLGLLLGVGSPALPASGAEPSTGSFPEVGRVPLVGGTEITGSLAQNGWLLLNPATRRGYVIMETGGPFRTVVQSFDLDTLRPRRRAVLAGVPITSGVADMTSVGVTQNAGEVVHAFDRERGRLYLALSDMSPVGTIPSLFGPADAQRPLARFVAIDEKRFDAGRPDFAASFREPVDPTDPLQARLHSYWLLGLTVTRHHVADGKPGRIVAFFAQPQPLTGAPGFYDHTLAQWDPSNLTFDDLRAPGATGSAGEDPTLTQNVRAAGPARQLDVCSAAPVATTGGGRQGNYQWGILATREALWTACQATDQAGVVARTPLDDDGHLDLLRSQERYPLSQRISDVLADEEGERLLVRSWGNGHTWWVFDTSLRRFTGSVSAKASDDYSLAAGLDPATGRLYQLNSDYAAGSIPVRGGFAYSDTRLDPAPSLENVRPDLAYPAVFAIRVDPVTRRVFVRRGHPVFHVTPVYPGTGSTTPAPPEPFYRVLRDNVPVAERPPPPDDRAFTADVEEGPLTRASYLGAGAGYGTRTWLVGGLDAATGRTAGSASPCGREDREVVLGAVRSVEVSDISTTADAASRDGNAKTQDDLRTPVNRCRPSQWENASNPARNQALPDTDEASFGPPGENRYRTTCVGDEAKSATAPPDKKVSRHRFEAGTTCDHAHGRATAHATGAFGSAEADAAQEGARDDATAGGQVPEEPVEVGYSHTEVTVTRKQGAGVTVKVEAIARNVVIPGVGTVGAIRGEATATATGRPGGATASYSRTVCGVRFGTFGRPDCYDETEQDDLERDLNQALGGRGKVRFRDPDTVLAKGSRSGYKAGVQRPADDRFEDATVNRDASLALPAMELVLYNGDGQGGTGRQFFHFAGVQAGTSYGIACLYGQRDDGRCAAADDLFGGPDDDGGATTPGEPEVVTVYEQGETVYAEGQPPASQPRPSVLERIVRLPVELAADVLRLLFANPREFGLMAAVWALLYLPCWLGERRRSIRMLRARQAVLRV